MLPPLPFLWIGWSYIGSPKGFGAILAVLSSYSAWIFAVAAIVQITGYAWRDWFKPPTSQIGARKQQKDKSDHSSEVAVLSITSNIEKRQQEIPHQPREEATFVIVGNLEIGRHHHISVLLKNDNVLIVGGYNNDNTETKILASAEIYHPTSRIFAQHGRMVIRRYFSAATLLGNGAVLITGGAGEKGEALDSAELYIPTTGTFSLVARMTTARRGHTATLLRDGKVLIVGGSDHTGFPTASAEIYDPILNTFKTTGSMNFARLTEHTPNAILLEDGRVMIAGGYDGITGAIASIELYDPGKGIFVDGGNMAMKRACHTLTALSNHRVLIAGGHDDSTVYLSSAEIYDPLEGNVVLTEDMKVPHFHHTATNLLNDQVLLVGGQSPLVELYDPKKNIFTTFGTLTTCRTLHTTIRLRDGRVLVVGGVSGNHSLASVELSPEINI
jgi:hypothetical protein